ALRTLPWIDGMWSWLACLRDSTIVGPAAARRRGTCRRLVRRFGHEEVPARTGLGPARGRDEIGQTPGPLGAQPEADLGERRIHLGVQAAQRLAHLGRPGVVDAELARLEPAALVRLDAPFLDRHHELVDLLPVLVRLLGVQVRGWRRTGERLGKRLVNEADFIQRRRRPFSDAELRRLEQGAAGLLQQLGLALEALAELLDVPLDLDLLGLRERALGLHEVSAGAEVLA